MTLKVPLPENGLTGQENLDFQRFVRDFHNRGRNALTIKAERGAEQVRDLFVKAGVRRREITVSKAISAATPFLCRLTPIRSNFPNAVTSPRKPPRTGPIAGTAVMDAPLGGTLAP